MSAVPPVLTGNRHPAPVTDSETLAQAHALSALLRSSRLTMLYGDGDGDAGVDRAALLRDGVLPLLRRRALDFAGARTRNRARPNLPFADRRRSAPHQAAEIVIAVDGWDEPPLPRAHRLLEQALAQHDAEHAGVPSGSLADHMRRLSARHGVRFLVLLDHFDDCLAGAPQRRDLRAFADELVQAVNQAELPANFLISLRDGTAPAVQGFERRIDGFDGRRLALPDHAPAAAQAPDAVADGGAPVAAEPSATASTESVYASIEAMLRKTAAADAPADASAVLPAPAARSAAPAASARAVGPPGGAAPARAAATTPQPSDWMAALHRSAHRGLTGAGRPVPPRAPSPAAADGTTQHAAAAPVAAARAVGPAALPTVESAAPPPAVAAFATAATAAAAPSPLVGNGSAEQTAAPAVAWRPVEPATSATASAMPPPAAPDAGTAVEAVPPFTAAAMTSHVGAATAVAAPRAMEPTALPALQPLAPPMAEPATPPPAAADAAVAPTAQAPVAAVAAPEPWPALPATAISTPRRRPVWQLAIDWLRLPTRPERAQRTAPMPGAWRQLPTRQIGWGALLVGGLAIVAFWPRPSAPPVDLSVPAPTQTQPGTADTSAARPPTPTVPTDPPRAAVQVPAPTPAPAPVAQPRAAATPMPQLAVAVGNDDPRAAQRLQDLARASGLPIAARPGGGWASSLAGLAPGGTERSPEAAAVPLALVHYDALQAARRRAGGTAAAPVQIVAPLFIDPVLLLVRADAPQRFVHQIRGLRIDAGGAADSRRLTADTLHQRLFGQPLPAAKGAASADPAQALQRLRRGESDVVLLVGAPPADQLAGLRVLALDPNAPASRRAQASFLQASWSGADARPTATLGLMSFLVAAQGAAAPADALGRVADALCQALPALRRDGDPGWRSVQLSLQPPVGWPYAASSTAAFAGCGQPAAVAANRPELSNPKGDRP